MVGNPDSGGGNNLSRSQIMSTAIVAVSALAIYLCYIILAPFLPSLVWAMAFAILSHPVFKKLRRLTGGRSLAAGLTVALVAMVVVVPLVLVGRQTVIEVLRNFDYARGAIEGGEWRAAIERSESVTQLLVWLEGSFSIDAGIGKLFAFLPGFVSGVLSGSALAALELLFIFFALFFLLRDSEMLVGAVRKVIPLTEEETSQVFRRIEDTVFATVYGEILISFITGALGGFMFWMLGFKAAVMWGFIMAILAFLPVVGTWTVWVPAAAYLFLEGRWGAGLTLLVWGVAAMTLLTSFLYPKLVGDRLRLHTLLVFIAIIGGISAFGLVGIVVGPLVLALTFALFDIWRTRLEKV